MLKPVFAVFCSALKRQISGNSAVPGDGIMNSGIGASKSWIG